jgi:signal transduction histidine kinase
MLFQVDREAEALQSICEILVDGDKFPLAWIGYCEDDAKKTIRPVAKAGTSLHFLERIENSWGSSETGEGPARIAVRSRRPYCINEISTGSSAPVWAALARDAGYASCVALPLVARDHRGGLTDLRGTLNLHSRDRNCFDDGTVDHYAGLVSCLTHAIAALRGHLAADLTSGVKSLRASEQRKRAEDTLRATRAELDRASRMASMGQMAASIAHEINQPLAAVVANGNAASRYLANETPDLEEARAAVHDIILDGHRASQVIGSVRAMFKQAPKENVLLDVNDLIREVVMLTQSEIQRRHVTVQTELMERIPQPLADRIQLQQVMLNLIMNALEAMDAVTDRARILSIKSSAQGTQSVQITVGDSGIGIEPNDLKRIFEGFFTTKTHGMGLGLSICRSIIEEHGGTLSASSGRPHGAVFQVILPTGASAA